MPDRIVAIRIQEQRTRVQSLRQLFRDAAVAGPADCRVQCHAFDRGENLPVAPHDA